MTVGGSSAAFIWFMNQQQARAGARLRATAAAALAEAGVYRAMAVLESVGPDGIGASCTWPPAAQTDAAMAGLARGRYTISVAEAPDGFVQVTSTGEVAGTTRRVRARIALASPALLTALHAASVIRIEPVPAATVILPYPSEFRGRPWTHIAVGRELWFPAPPAGIDDRAGALELPPGPIDPPVATSPPAPPGTPGPVRLLLADAADVTVAPNHQRVESSLLGTVGIRLDAAIRRTRAFPRPPEVNRAYYSMLATANLANRRINAAAGRQAGNGDLERKRDSLYSSTEFAQVRAYLQSVAPAPHLSGPIYVAGGVVLGEGERLQIADGALVTEGSVHVRAGARLEITHTAATRSLPALLVLDHGALLIGEGARLLAHGLIMTGSVFDVSLDARVDVVGGVMAGDRGLSFRNAATVVIRYDPAVLGTPGLIPPREGPVVAWIAAWEEER